MPHITYTTVEGVLDDEQKEALSRALTNAVTETLGAKLKPNVWVTLQELPEGNFYIGGRALSPQVIKDNMG